MSKAIRWLSWMTALVIGSVAPVASAVELVWQAPDQCPRHETIAAEIARLAGSDEGQSLRANVVVLHPEGERWRVVIDLSGSAAGHRELTADSCAQLSKAAALIIALAANPDAALDLPTEEAKSDEPAPSPAVVPLAPQPTPKRAVDSETGSPPRPNPSRNRTTFEPFAALGYDSGTLPLGAALLRLGVTLNHGWFHSSLSLDVTETKGIEFVGGYGARFRATGGQWLGCGEPWNMPLRAMFCLGPRLELLQVNGYGSTENFAKRVWRPEAIAGLLLSYPVVSRVRLGTSAELLVPLRRPHFVIENIDVNLYETSRFVGRVLLVAEIPL